MAIQGGVLADGVDGRYSVLGNIDNQQQSNQGDDTVLPAEHTFTLDTPLGYGSGEDEDSIAVRLPAIVNTSDFSGAQATKTGPYKITITGDGRDDQSLVIGRWNSETTVLVNNLQEQYDLAPGWSFPFENQLFVGTIGGGEVDKPEDTGAALFRGNQTASWFKTEAFTPPAEVFSKLRPEGPGFELVEPDGSKQVFTSSGRVTSTIYQTAYIMTESHDSAGNITKFQYDGEKIATIIDPLGRQTSFDWSTFTSADPINDGSTIENYLRITDWRGRTTHYEYHVFSDQRNPYLVVRHPDPDDNNS